MAFNRSYFLKFLVLLTIEVGIATLIKSGFVRHTLGDFLAVIMVYCLIKSFFNIKPLVAAWIVLVFSTLVEIGQYFDLLEALNWNHNPIANVVLGNTFSYTDLVAYMLGIITVMILENRFSKPPEIN